MKKYLILLLANLPLASFSQTNSKLTAQDIFKKSEATYAGLSTYLDSGKVINEYYKTSSSNKSALKFRTAYSHEFGFNFEYYVPNKSNSLFTINKQGSSVKTWWGLTNETKNTTFPLAIASATGVSSGTSSLVPGLLFPSELKNRKFYYDIVATVSAKEKVDNETCFRIDGTKKGEKVSIWISQSDFLIRKIITDKTINPKATQLKRDSILKTQLVVLKARLLKEKEPAAKAELLHSIKLIETQQATAQKKEKLSELIRDGRAREVFSVKTTYYYFPYKSKSPDKKPFSFRPNREVEL